MDRETWFRILQIAVVAPFIYSISEKQKGYFRLGLKMVAGSIIIMNVPPLIAQIQPLLVAAAKLKADADIIAMRNNVIEGQAETV